MEVLEKSIPFLITTIVGFGLGQLSNFFKSWLDEIREKAIVGLKADSAHKRLDELVQKVDAIAKIQTVQLNDLSHYIINKGDKK